VRVNRAKRRWLRWCRYIDKTQSMANGSRKRWTEIHVGQAKAFEDVMHARRYAPIGVRVVWYPKWGSAR
jgi:hypothetical protein